ncbi:hypothetical protein RvY_17927 [Ramazzottius varieornatus]|uniref:methylated diphthine methylhydrolase n=1 Tax=Ramazzottius varieornatus TaxID=947166 RepID=A0A1D1WAD5_RAMVA|nr:hypothetical protein RvY_17927 [Ramazzottius varieornatus]
MEIMHRSSMDTGSYAACCSYLPDGSLLCGTYQLQDKSTNTSEEHRLGNVLHFTHGNDGEVGLLQSMTPTSGILDIQVKDNLASVMLADGTVSFLGLSNSFRLNLHEDQIDKSFAEVQQNVSVVSEGLCLAGAWSDDSRMAVSDSKGGVSLIKKGEHSFGVSNHKDNVHEYEVWSVCWDCKNNDVLYSGADDSFLKMHDLRSDSAVVTVKGHDAGVTSVVSSSSMENTLITGSYDEHIRSWDKRMLKSASATLKLGGGVWRIKASPEDDTLLACACMHSGARIVRLNETGFVLQHSFMEGRQLVYGIDWCPTRRPKNRKPDGKTTNGEAHFLAACSFYDHILDIYSFLPSRSSIE